MIQLVNLTSLFESFIIYHDYYQYFVHSFIFGKFLILVSVMGDLELISGTLSLVLE